MSSARKRFEPGSGLMAVALDGTQRPNYVRNLARGPTRVSQQRNSSMSHTVILDLTVNAGTGESVIPMIIASLADTRARKGAELIEAYVDADNPDHLVIWEKWTTRADQESYLAWRIETGMPEMLAPLLAEPLRIIHLSPAE